MQKEYSRWRAWVAEGIDSAWMPVVLRFYTATGSVRPTLTHTQRERVRLATIRETCVIDYGEVQQEQLLRTVGHILETLIVGGGVKRCEDLSIVLARVTARH